MNEKEKRIYPRTELRWPVSAITNGGTIQGETKNISMRGAFICCPHPLRPDERLLLTVSGPSGFIQVIAQVVWSNIPARTDDDTPNGMGVSFIWSLPKTQALCA